MNRTLQRALWSRPLVLVVGGIGSGFLNQGLQPGLFLEVLILSLVGPAALAALVAQRPSLARVATAVSIALGLTGWAIFAILTGGARSPLVVGFLLEIVVAVVSMSPRGVFAVTGGSVAWLAVMAPLGGRGTVGIVAIEISLVIAVGALGGVMARRRQLGEVALRTQGEELGQRLEALQRELEDERVISRVGENVARLAHGLKNAVHSLRGFVGLIEPQLERGAGTSAALAGLHAAIDDLEKLARLTLADTGAPTPGSAPDPRPVTSSAASAARPSEGSAPVGGESAPLGEAVVAARAELEAASPDVAWTVAAGPGASDARVALARDTLLELLVILMRNAVEAMEGRGAAQVELDRLGRFVRVAISDEGPGFPPDVLDRGLQPGYTTKAQGSGFGLFLARRIADDHGGRLEIGNRDGGGAYVQVALPCIPED